MNVLMCFDELVPHFGPGAFAVAMAAALGARGHHVAVFVENPIADDNQYAAALRAAGSRVYAPGIVARAADHWVRSNHLLLLGLIPVRAPLALADALVRRRAPARAWRGVAGRLNRFLPSRRLADPLRYALFAALDREQQRRPAALLHMLTGNGSGFDWAARRGVPIVYNENIVPSQDRGVRWWTDARRHAERIAMTTSLCAAAIPAIRSVLGYRGPVAVVPSTIADPLGGRAQGAGVPTHSSVVIGCAARLAAAKGIDVLLRAFAAVATRGAVELWIAGEGPERAALERLAGEFGIGARVRFLGHCSPSDMDRFWAAIDVFVLASRWEGLPLALIEAMAHGKAVIATAVDGIPEAIVHGEAGILVPPDAVEPLAAALGELIGDAARRGVLGRAARARFLASFSAERVVERLLDAYRQVVPHGG
jgi:glycosyltransferase involved in cell wall biosynthesis